MNGVKNPSFEASSAKTNEGLHVFFNACNFILMCRRKLDNIVLRTTCVYIFIYVTGENLTCGLKYNFEIVKIDSYGLLRQSPFYCRKASLTPYLSTHTFR